MEILTPEEMQKALNDCQDAFYDADTTQNAGHNFIAHAQLLKDQEWAKNHPDAYFISKKFMQQLKQQYGGGNEQNPLV